MKEETNQKGIGFIYLIIAIITTFLIIGINDKLGKVIQIILILTWTIILPIICGISIKKMFI